MFRETNINANQGVLITGISGYLGSHLARKMQSEGYQVFGLVRKSSKLTRIDDLLNKIELIVLDGQPETDSEILENAFREKSISTVVHCATSYGRNKESFEEIQNANFNLPKQIVKCGLKYSLKTFINTHTLLDRQTNPYSQTKYEFWDYLKLLGDKVQVYNMTLEHFYGPDDDPSKFLSWIIKNFLDGVKTLPLTYGEQKRDFIFIEDIVEAYSLLLMKISEKSFKASHDLEIGTGILTSIKDVVILTHQLCGSPPTQLDFGKVPYRPGEKMQFEVNLEAIRSLGWFAKTELKQGLEKTISFEKNKRNIK